MKLTLEIANDRVAAFIEALSSAIDLAEEQRDACADSGDADAAEAWDEDRRCLQELLTAVDEDAKKQLLLVYQFTHGLELSMPLACVEDCSARGSNDDAVAHWVQRLDWSGIDADAVREELREYGAWDDEQLEDDDENRARLLWLAAHGIKEDQ